MYSCGGASRRKPKTFNIVCANPYQYFLNIIKEIFPYRGSGLTYPEYREVIKNFYQIVNTPNPDIRSGSIYSNLWDSFWNYDTMYGNRFLKYIYINTDTAFQDIKPDRKTLNIIPIAPPYVPYKGSYTRQTQPKPVRTRAKFIAPRTLIPPPFSKSKAVLPPFAQ